MTRAPNLILEELHKVREAIADDSHQDLRKIAEAAKARQEGSGHEIVRLSPKRIEPTKKAS